MADALLLLNKGKNKENFAVPQTDLLCRYFIWLPSISLPFRNEETFCYLRKEKSNLFATILPCVQVAMQHLLNMFRKKFVPNAAKNYICISTVNHLNYFPEKYFVSGDNHFLLPEMTK